MSVLGAALGLLAGLISAPLSSVLMDRPPLRENDNESLRAPFRCRSCRARVGVRDAIPLLGQLRLRGRCGGCGQPLRRELLNDVMCLAVGALTGAFVGVTAVLPAMLVLSLVLVPIALIDLELRKIPTRLVYPASAVVAVLLAVAAVADGDARRLGRAVAAGVLASALLWLLVIVYPAGMGDGDARLCLLLGLGLGWYGWMHVAYGIMAGFVIGSVVGIGYAVTSGQGRKAQLPFGPWLGAGAFLVILSAAHIPIGA